VVLPAKTHIRIIVTSADVPHSWAVPSSGVKCDAVPGRLSPGVGETVAYPFLIASPSESTSSTGSGNWRQFLNSSPSSSATGSGLGRGEGTSNPPTPNWALPDNTDPGFLALDLVSRKCSEAQLEIVAGATGILGEDNFRGGDIERAVDMALFEDWEVPSERRLAHFNRLRGSLKEGSPLLRRIMRVLRDLGHENVPDPDEYP